MVTKARFQEINEAHDTLKNSQKRHDYDTMRKFGGSDTGGGQHPFFNEDIFGDFFSGFGKVETWISIVDSTSHRTGRARTATIRNDSRATGMYR